MKKFFTVLVLVLLVAANSYSQEKYSVITSVGGGINLPIGDFKDSYLNYGYGMGYNGHLDASMLFTPGIGGRFDITYYNFPLNKDNFSSPYPVMGTVNGGDITLIGAKLNFIGGLLKPSEKAIIYGIVGFGVYFSTVNDIEVKDPSGTVLQRIFGSNSAFFGGSVGARFSYKVDKNVALFAEGAFETYFPTEKWAKMTFGYKNFFIPAKVGVMITVL
jgi:hypothetical protein